MCIGQKREGIGLPFLNLNQLKIKYMENNRKRVHKTVQKVEKVSLSHLKAFQIKKRSVFGIYEKKMHRLAIETKEYFRKITFENELIERSEALNDTKYYNEAYKYFSF